MVLTPEQLYKSAMRMRLTRAGLLKIMRENDAKAAAKDADAVIKEYTEGFQARLDRLTGRDAVR
jgi:hypothetical protein